MGALRYNFDLIFANLLFGANFSFYVSLTRNYLDFQQIFMLQVLAASIFFIPFALFSKQSYRIPLRDFGNILIVTVLIVYGWMFMLLWGASYTSPIDASTISTLGPVFTILTGHFLLREKNITWARRIGVVLGFAGAAFLLFDKGFRLAPGSSGLGNALVLVAVVAIAVNTVIIKPQLQRYGTLVVMGWYYIIGLLITAPFFWKYIADTDFLRLPLSGQAELAYVLVLGTVLPMYLLYRGTEKLTFIHTALYRYIQPVVATVLALVRHQEQIDRTNIIAGVLIFASIILVIRDHDRGAFGLYRFPPGGIAPDDLLEEGDALVTYFGDRSRDVDVVLHPDLLFEGVRGRGRDDAARSGEYVVLQDLPVEIRFAQVEIHLLRYIVHVLEHVDIRNTLLNKSFDDSCHKVYLLGQEPVAAFGGGSGQALCLVDGKKRPEFCRCFIRG